MVFGIMVVYYQAQAQSLRWSASAGQVTGETSAFKKNMRYSEFALGRESRSRRRVSMLTMLGLSNTSYDFYDAQASHGYTRIISVVPCIMLLHFIAKPSQAIRCYGGFGTVAHIDAVSTMQIWTPGGSMVRHQWLSGLNVAPLIASGIDFRSGPRSHIGFVLTAQKDLLTHFKNAAVPVKYNRVLLSVQYVREKQQHGF